MLKKFKLFKKSLKESNKKILIYILGILSIINLGAAIYFIYSLMLLSGIETIIRYGIITFALIMALLFIYFWMKAVIKNKNWFYILILILLIISVGAQTFVGYNIIKVYEPINTINKKSISYTTDLIVLKDSNINDISDLKDMTIGIISKDKSEEDYTIATEIIEENNLESSNEIKEYSDYVSMLNDLYDGNIDATFITSKYTVMFNTIEKFENIKDDVNVVTSKTKDFKKQNQQESINTKNIVKEPFTVLLMGVDSEQDGLEKDAAFNGDSLMLITFNPNTLNATVLSIPRDTYVPIMCFANNKKNKITHASWQGVSCMQDTIENFTGIEIDYYVKMNFKGVVDLVDALGGIDVDVPFEFCEQNSDRQFGSSTICLKTGEQHLNGEQALALARHRKTLALGDIQRGLNQQLVIEGMLKKVSTIDSLDKINELLDTVSKNMDTNLTTNQILSFYNVAKNILLTSQTDSNELISMEKLYLDGYTKMIYDESFGFNLSNYIYYKSSLKAVVNAMEVNLGLKEATMTKTFDFSINEVYEKKIIGQGEKDNESSIATLPSFIGDSKSYVTSWANARNISVSFTEVKQGDKGYDEKYSDGTVVTQSVAQGTELTKVKSITFGIINKEGSTTTENESTSACEEGTSNTKCYLPNLIGKTKKEVDTWSTTLPVSVRIEYKGTLTSDSVVVVKVSKTSNSLLETGESIVITFEEKEESDDNNSSNESDKYDENTSDSSDNTNDTENNETSDPAIDNSGVTND